MLRLTCWELYLTVGQSGDDLESMLFPGTQAIEISGSIKGVPPFVKRECRGKA